MIPSKQISRVHPFITGGILLDIAWLASISIVYMLAVQVGFLFRVQPVGVAAIWPPSGVALAALLLSVRRKWVLVLLVIFTTNTLGNLIGDNSFQVSLGFALANITEATAGAWLITHFFGPKITFSRTAEVIALCVVATLSNGITAMLGAAVPTLAFGVPFFETWFVWWVSDGLGIILVTPIIVTWVTSPNVLQSLSFRRFIEGAILITILSYLTWLIYDSCTTAEQSFLSIYMVYPLLIWAAMRFSPRGTVTVILFFAVTSILCTAYGYSMFEFADHQLKEKVLSVQILISIVTISGLILATVVTECKQTEETLRASRDYLEKLTNSMWDTVFSVKMPERVIEWANDSFRLIGYEPSECVGKTTDFLYPDKSGFLDFGNKLKNAMAVGKDVLHTEQLLRRKSGEVFPAEITVTFHKEKDEVVSVTSIIRDISERKQAEEERKQAEEALQEAYNIINRSPAVAFLWKNLEGWPVEFVSDNAKDLFGYTADEFTSSQVSYVRTVHPDDLEKVAEEVSTFSNEKGRMDFIHEPYRIITKDGKVKWVDDRTYIRRDNKGNITHYEGIVIDITDRVQAAEALREGEEKYRSMMEAMDDAAYICSPDFRIEYMNSAMIKRIGYDAIGEPCHKVMHGLDEKCPWCVHGEVMRGEHIKTEVVSPKDGRDFLVSSSPIFHTDTDGSISTFTIFRDITEYKKIEAQLRQAQKMESIGTLAGGIAHDFNNILSCVSGYTELSLDNTRKGTLLHENLQEVFSAAKRAKDLVKQILTFSRQADQKLEPLNVQLIVREALKLIRASLPSTIEIEHNISNRCGLVMADASQIHQTAMNLLTNAFQAMEDEGGKLDVTLKEIDLDVDDLKGPAMVPGPYVCLTVSDTGTGIDKSVINRIFDPYFSTKEKHKGTGLGLSTVYGIVKGYGGNIRVYSEPGKGTTFHVYLPVIQTRAEKEETRVISPVEMGTERILFVDDEEQIVRMSQQILESLGYHVTARTSSIETLEAFRAAPDKFDLVITDTTMPNMTGIELARKLMEVRPDIPIIICTGFSEKIRTDKAKDMGIRGFVMKPVVRSELAKKIREVLER